MIAQMDWQSGAGEMYRPRALLCSIIAPLRLSLTCYYPQFFVLSLHGGRSLVVDKVTDISGDERVGSDSGHMDVNIYSH